MNPPLNLLHLKFFCDAVFYNSVSEAAKMNYVTQSAVSQAIAKLEKAVGAQLVLHARQKFQPTPEGRVVFEQASHIFQAVNEISLRLNQDKMQVRETLKFATTKSLGMSFLAPIYSWLKTHLPLVSPDFVLGGLNYIRNALRQNEVEFAIVVYDKDFEQFTKHTLRRGTFQLYQHVESTFDQVEKCVFVNYYEGTYVQALYDLLKKNQMSPLKIQALAGWEVIARFVELNLGLGFFPDYIVANGRYPKLKTAPIELPLFYYDICIIHNKDKQLSRSAQFVLNQFVSNELEI